MHDQLPTPKICFLPLSPQKMTHLTNTMFSSGYFMICLNGWHTLKKRVQKTCTRNVRWCMWPKLFFDSSAVFESFCNLHRIELCSIWCKLLAQVSWVCVTPNSNVSSYLLTPKKNPLHPTKKLIHYMLVLQLLHLTMHWTIGLLDYYTIAAIVSQQCLVLHSVIADYRSPCNATCSRNGNRPLQRQFILLFWQFNNCYLIHHSYVSISYWWPFVNKQKLLGW